jgi:hypothetical protein
MMSNKPEDTKDWVGKIITMSGVVFDIQKPTMGMINIIDISHSLALQCRYNGHIPGFYSVAEHSVKVMEWLVENGHEEHALHGLMHDASEAYIGDLVSPMKKIPGFGQMFKAYEKELDDIIADRFFMEPHYNIPAVHEADMAVYDWEVEYIRTGIKTGVGPSQAREMFLDAYVKYGVTSV